jgi:hypothetical protein
MKIITSIRRRSVNGPGYGHVVVKADEAEKRVANGSGERAVYVQRL